VRTYVLLAFALICAIARPASAQLTITATPAAPIDFQTVTFVVHSPTDCTFSLGYGDSTVTDLGVIHNGVSKGIQHKFPVGPTTTYPIAANPAGFLNPFSAQPCLTIGKLSLEVKGFKLPPIKPTIEQLFIFSSVTPHGTVALKGNFGPTRGHLFLKLPSTKQIEVTDELSEGPDDPAGPLQWTTHLIGARLSSAIAGEVKGGAAFRVQAANGAFSNWFAVTFTPTTDFVVLDPSHVVVNSCSDDAGDNQCNDVTNGHLNAWSVLAQGTIPGPKGITLNTQGTGAGGPSIGSHHASDWGLASDDDVDRYDIALANGWRVDHLRVDVFLGDNGTVDVPQSIADDATSGQLVVHYHIGASGGAVAYGATIVIRGPKGVPFSF
jgi:hypothetical protein